MKNEFKRGDWVTWSSQAAGSTITKFGRIVAVVRAGSDPSDVAAKAGLLYNSETTLPRPERSYLVEVAAIRRIIGGIKRVPPKVYWPRVKALKVMTKAQVTAFVDAIQKPLKKKPMTCECGGKYQEVEKEFKGVKCPVMECRKCGDVMFTIEQSKNYHRRGGR